MRPPLARLAVGILAALGALQLLVSATPLVLWWAGRLASPWDDPKGVLVALGAEMQVDGKVGEGVMGRSTYLRAYYVAKFWKEGCCSKIILTGDQTAPAMKRFLVSEGVPDDVIHVEALATSTWDNAARVRSLLAGERGPITLLTSDYHMRRAWLVFQKQGMTVRGCPAPDVLKLAQGWGGRWPAFLVLVDETVKLLYYGLRGRL